MKAFILIILAIGLLSPIGFAQEIDKSKLDSYFEALEVNNKFMGSVAVSQNGELIYTKSVGFSDIGNEQKATDNSRYRIGSISKTFTAVLVLKAIEEKKLALNQTIETYFPSVPNADKITIRQLLYHRSGIHNFTDDKEYLTWYQQPKTAQEMVAVIAKLGSDFTPDSKAVYSNSNYVLLTYILEKTYDQSYSTLLQNYIAEPAGLGNTYLGEDIKPEHHESYSYRFSGSWKLEPETDPSIPLGAGGIVSTPTDLVRFSDALFSGKLIEPSSLEQMKTIQNTFGMGLIITPFYDKMGFGHSGSIDGFNAVFSHFPSEDLSFAMTSNGSYYNTNDIALSVLAAVFDKAYEIPVFTTFEVTSEDLDKYLGEYSSTQNPLKVTISKDDKTLIAQATGQSSFPLEPVEENVFKFDQAGVVLEFNPGEKTMILKQGGLEFLFNKE